MFDQEVARKALYSMIILHEYPLSIIDHYGFRNFVTALQPLFKMGTRNTIRKDIMHFYEGEKRKARIFLQRTNCRVAVTTDLWTDDCIPLKLFVMHCTSASRAGILIGGYQP
jgi:hypothetical protein